MKRSYLQALGLEKDIIDQIMKEHGNTVELLKEKYDEDSEQKTLKLNKTINEMKEQIDNIPDQTQTDGKDWKSEYDALQQKYNTDVGAKQKEYDDLKSTLESQKETIAKQSVLRKQLVKDGANNDLIDLLELKFDLNNIVLDGDNIKDWESISKPIKEQYAGVFGTVQVEKTNPATPPVQETQEKDFFIEGFEDKK